MLTHSLSSSVLYICISCVVYWFIVDSLIKYAWWSYGKVSWDALWVWTKNHFVFWVCFVVHVGILYFLWVWNIYIYIYNVTLVFLWVVSCELCRYHLEVPNTHGCNRKDKFHWKLCALPQCPLDTRCYYRCLSMFCSCLRCLSRVVFAL
jgi:hypothetical protein